jgi:penicillin-binding protein-related factor A (putative recombinase)
MLEKHIQAQILHYLVLKNVFHWRNNTGCATYQSKNGKKSFVRFGQPGMSDILGIYKGKFLAIEVKRPGGKVTELQKKFLEAIESNDGIAILAYDLDDVKKVIA